MRKGLTIFWVAGFTLSSALWAEQNISPLTLANPGFQGVILAIANLNKAMRDASENPMDRWRRENVRRAVGIMPVAIRALAAEYGGFKLNGLEFPMVQATLVRGYRRQSGSSHQEEMKQAATACGPGQRASGRCVE